MDLSIYLSDGNMQKGPYLFKIRMINTPPTFKTELKDRYRVQLNTDYFLRFPLTIDLERNPVFFRFTNLPSFLIFDNVDKILVMRPREPRTDLGRFKVTGMITDTNKKTDFEFIVDSFNNPPMIKSPIEDKKVTLDETTVYSVPAIEDEEKLPIKAYMMRPPSFIKYDRKTHTLKFSPNNIEDVGEHKVLFCYTDSYSPA